MIPQTITYQVIIVANIEVTPRAEIFWEGIDQAERCIEQQVSLLLLQLSGDREIVIRDVVLTPIQAL